MQELHPDARGDEHRHGQQLAHQLDQRAHAFAATVVPKAEEGHNGGAAQDAAQLLQVSGQRQDVPEQEQRQHKAQVHGGPA